MGQTTTTTVPAAGAAAGGQGATTVIAIRVDKTMIIISSVVGSLGLLSAILGFAAEGTNSSSIFCSTQSSVAGLGFGAAIILVIAQVTVSVVGGCCGCCASRAIPSETKRIIGVICAVVSWVLAAIGFVLLLAGSIVAAECNLVKGGIFAGAGVLALFATALGITSYIMLRAQPQSRSPAAPPADEPVPIGMPYPPPSPNPLPPPTSSPNYAPYPPSPPPPFPAPGAIPPPQVGGYGLAPNQQFVAPPPAQP
ncbi:hypothetical protein GUJ93_ZPchr0005g16061 [Zizania palustris]|uniref:Uncharacterized protein n=1 Tax=Zizania palustris TaxID=103762 RepID=A0A8J5S444_ZIZPA|nr:hypothetical protein GUJ93_ZPchr0005g16061 [Zizania palustris]